MASIINATTSTGLVSSADNSGSLQLATNNGTTAVTIDTSQRVAFVAGTAALPAITTTGDTNTGIFFSAADTIDFAEGGTAVGQFDSSGNFKFNSGYGSAAVAYGCRAWVNFNGTGTVAIRASGNVSSIGDMGDGDYYVNFTTAMPDANYCVTTTSGNGNGRFVSIFNSDSDVQAALSTGSVRVQNAFQVSSSPSRSDTNHFSVAIFR